MVLKRLGSDQEVVRGSLDHRDGATSFGCVYICY